MMDQAKNRVLHVSILRRGICIADAVIPSGATTRQSRGTLHFVFQLKARS